MPNRDEFNDKVRRVIAARVGFRCARPDCQTETAGPTKDTSNSYNIGVAAHITAAAPGGPRYDSALSSQQRRHPDNGIWLCQTHAKEIDDDPIKYPVDLLNAWKRDAEQRAKARLGKIVPGDLAPLVAVSDAERYGLETQAILPDGRYIPMASPFCPEDNPTFYANPAYVVRFMVLMHPDAKTPVLINQIRATCYRHTALPEYGYAAYALPVTVNPYVVMIEPPLGNRPRPSIAELRFHNDQDEAIRFAPLALDPKTPEVVDVRFNALQSGVFTVALDVILNCGVEKHTYRVLDETEVLFLEPFNPDAA